MATYASIKSELGASTLTFFKSLDKEGVATDWNRARTINNDLIIAHDEVIEELRESFKEGAELISNLYLKRKADVVLEKEGITLRAFVLCRSDKEATLEM